jgi:hypothetical protein
MSLQTFYAMVGQMMSDVYLEIWKVTNPDGTSFEVVGYLSAIEWLNRLPGSTITPTHKFQLV